MTNYPGSGDARRSLELLWGHRRPGTRGRRPELGVESLVEAAVAIADADGLAAVSMRSVAQALGCSTMALYTYVPGKAELLDLMHDTVLAELPTQRWNDPAWRAALERSVRDTWEMYERHPWMLAVSEARASLGPRSIDVFEAQARILDTIGLAGPDVVRLAGALSLFVKAAAQVVAEARDAARVTGQTDDEWWQARASVFDELTDHIDWQARYPTISRLQSEQVFEQLDRAPDDSSGYLEREALDSFELGLRCLLDGIEAMLR